ncbi:NAD(P)H-dependent oxidoreductase [Escherichia coli]|nr:NAD(P)H-dependent oxidoreductase [Escherichia coli]
MVAQNEDDTQSHSGCVKTPGLCRPPEDLREGNDVSAPAKVLLLYAHPESQDSVANRVLLKAGHAAPAMLPCTTFTRTIPIFLLISPVSEQALLREHEVIVFQHPLYTYSCPALLKEWLDRVLSRGFRQRRREKPTGGKVLA